MNEDPILDAAARAGWLYYAAGRTQDQIAADMGISRQRAQRLVSRAMAEGLIRVRLEHPIAACMELEARLRARFDLREVRVAPSTGRDPTLSVAPAAAALFETILTREEPQIIGLGTGRALTAMAAEVQALPCARHTLVSLIGNIGEDGAASRFEVLLRMATKLGAPHYPMSAPVLTETPEERDLFLSLPPVRRVRDLATRATVLFIGVGQMGEDAPLKQDGFLMPDELARLQAEGAMGEVTGHVFDAEGAYLPTPLADRMTAVRVEPGKDHLAIGVAAGPAKIGALRAALNGRILNGLVTDEDTAITLLG
ncbi:sugar-binding transcriptional regulator [Falsirhodobacter halotolerans]|uniref:sugar-binding transcriptional regulator n=1 Tax=Falsirhodobacter halotolerans TaxID=1146892 RepID=UPI001FD4F82B|nr:sugar-binding transcriptional regulator [Falsirhodobacter halotolerans]MCJ8139710.1 sugar-binding transcriptional regulator [Falsirhodobacter halotolerans]